MALLTPSRGRDGVSMVFADEASGNRLPVVWPSGYSARQRTAAPNWSPDGSVLARDGDVISGLASERQTMATTWSALMAHPSQ
jgi:hypothetical protein